MYFDTWGWLAIAHGDDRRHGEAAAWKLSKKFAGKPDISFADFTSFVVMKELRLAEAFTADRHFESMGMGFRKLF